MLDTKKKALSAVDTDKAPTRPKGLEPSTFGSTVRCSKVATLVKPKSYSRPKQALTNQLTKGIPKQLKIRLRIYLVT